MAMHKVCQQDQQGERPPMEPGRAPQKGMEERALGSGSAKAHPGVDDKEEAADHRAGTNHHLDDSRPAAEAQQAGKVYHIAFLSGGFFGPSHWTARLRAELERLWTKSPRQVDRLVFGIKSDIKRAFASACEDAKITDLRFHDLRHCATTRLVETKALHTIEAMAITGHQQQTTFQRYVNPQDETARRAAEALDEWLAIAETEPKRPDLVN